MLSLFFGVGTFAGLSAWQASRHQNFFGARTKEILWVAVTEPISKWSAPFAEMFMWPLVGATLITGLFFYVFRNFKWPSGGAKNLRSSKSAYEVVAMSAPETEARIYAGDFNGSRFWASDEDRALVIGPPGTGKTVFLLNQLLKCAEQNMSFVCVDFKPEIYKKVSPKLKKMGMNVLCVDPVSGESLDHWNLLEEIDGEDITSLNEISDALLPISDPKNRVFTESSRDWLRASMLHLKHEDQKVSLPQIYDFLSSQPPATLAKLLSRSASEPAKRIGLRLEAGMNDSKSLAQNGYEGATRDLQFLGFPSVKAALSYSDFSMLEMGTGKPTALFIRFSETKASSMAPVLTMMMTRILSTLINTYERRKTVAIFLDELGAITPIPGLDKTLNTIRSRHMPTWAYFQTVEQLDAQYGRGAANKFFAAATTKICFRLDDQAARESLSALIGKTKEYKITTSKTESGVSETRSYEWREVIMPHEIGALEKGDMILLRNGKSAIGRGKAHYEDYPEFRQKK